MPRRSCEPVNLYGRVERSSNKKKRKITRDNETADINHKYVCVYCMSTSMPLGCEVKFRFFDTDHLEEMLRVCDTFVNEDGAADLNSDEILSDSSWTNVLECGDESSRVASLTSSPPHDDRCSGDLFDGITKNIGAIQKNLINFPGYTICIQLQMRLMQWQLFEKSIDKSSTGFKQCGTAMQSKIKPIFDKIPVKQIILFRTVRDKLNKLSRVFNTVEDCEWWMSQVTKIQLSRLRKVCMRKSWAFVSARYTNIEDLRTFYTQHVLSGDQCSTDVVFRACLSSQIEPCDVSSCDSESDESTCDDDEDEQRVKAPPTEATIAESDHEGDNAHDDTTRPSSSDADAPMDVDDDIVDLRDDIYIAGGGFDDENESEKEEDGDDNDVCTPADSSRRMPTPRNASRKRASSSENNDANATDDDENEIPSKVRAPVIGTVAAVFRKQAKKRSRSSSSSSSSSSEKQISKFKDTFTMFMTDEQVDAAVSEMKSSKATMRLSMPQI